MAHSVGSRVKPQTARPGSRRSWHLHLVLLLLIACATYLGCIVSPPSLMDDTDAVEAQIATNMLASGDWVTAHLDGVAYLEKSPLNYWLEASSYWIFGNYDWAARIPFALFAIGLAWLTAAFGRWAFDGMAGFYSGLVVATCVGLFLFTRVLIPDVMLTFFITLAMWAFLRVLDEEERHPRAWAYTLAASLALGLLLKSLIALVFPLGAAIVYLFLTRRLFSRSTWKPTWKRFYPLSSGALLLAIAAPWHILATLANPPYFAFTLHSGPGMYHGFLWFYFINEQLLRFLDLRYPRDYATVPRLYFWLFHLIWLFPWSVYLPAVFKLRYRAVDRAGKTRLLALCWIGFLMAFFTFSTTQEYYSMPIYPALALLLGSAMEAGGSRIRWGTRALTVITALAGLAAIAILIAVRHVPTPGDITAALSKHPTAYKLSLGHMEDLTLDSFAYLRFPLALAAVAFVAGAVGTLGKRAFFAVALAVALMMVAFFQAARIAMVTFDPFLSSRPLARAILAGPPGTVIVDSQYYIFSSIPFYTGRNELLLNGRWNNLEYGSYAPGAPDVFINDAKFQQLWVTPARYYLVTKMANRPRLEKLVGADKLHVVASGGGKLVYTNLLNLAIVKPEEQ